MKYRAKEMARVRARARARGRRDIARRESMEGFDREKGERKLKNEKSCEADCDRERERARERWMHMWRGRAMVREI